MTLTEPLVTLTDIQAAQERLRGLIYRTPLVPFPGALGLRLKAESLQPTGAFKLRGAFNAILSLTEAERERGVVAHSSGNHAQAVAYAARSLGVRATIVMPENAPQVKLERTRALGAEVVLVAPSGAARAAKTEELAEQYGYVPIPPYDDARIIAGAGTAGLEILEDAPDVETILVPISGGGLIAGVAAAVKRTKPGARVIGVEPELAADARASFLAGAPVAWEAHEVGRTLADGLRVQQLGALNWPHVRAFVDDIVTVTEDELRAAVRRTALEARLIAEPSGAVTVAAALRANALSAHQFGETVAVLSGGTVDPALLAEILTS